MTKYTIAEALGTYSTKFSQKKSRGRKVWERLERLGMLINPRSTFNHLPLKTRFVLALPYEEIDLIMSKIKSNGKSFQGNHGPKEEKPEWFKPTATVEVDELIKGEEIDVKIIEPVEEKDIDPFELAEEVATIEEKTEIGQAKRIVLQIKDVKITIDL